MEGWGKKTATTFFSFMPRFSEFCDCFCCYLVGEGGVRQRVQIRLCFSVAQSLSNVQMRINNRRLLGMKLMVLYGVM